MRLKECLDIACALSDFLDDPVFVRSGDWLVRVSRRVRGDKYDGYEYIPYEYPVVDLTWGGYSINNISGANQNVQMYFIDRHCSEGWYIVISHEQKCEFDSLVRKINECMEVSKYV